MRRAATAPPGRPPSEPRTARRPSPHAHLRRTTMTTGAMPPARSTPRERAVLLVLLGAGFMLSVDFSILTVALPDIGAGVGLDLERLPWITTAFVLPAAGFTL